MIRSPRAGFTLIELMVVAVIIAVLAAIIVPALQKAQAKAVTRRCMTIGTSIGTTIRAYSLRWKGYTHPDRDYYIKEFGYKLSSESGYVDGDDPYEWYEADATAPSPSQVHAANIKDFSCPIQSGIPINSHGIPSSYIVVGPAVGGNMMNTLLEPSKTPIVAEVGDRHPGEGESLENNIVFMDGHSVLGGPDIFLAGLNVKGWNTGSGGDFDSAKSNSLNTSPDYGPTMWTRSIFGNRTVFNGVLPNPPWGTDPNNILLHFWGYIDIPETGLWRFRTDEDDWGWFWIDRNQNKNQEGGEISGGNGGGTERTWSMQAGRYQFIYQFHEFSGGENFNLRWWGPNSNPNGVSIPASAFFHLPGEEF